MIICGESISWFREPAPITVRVKDHYSLIQTFSTHLLRIEGRWNWCQELSLDTPRPSQPPRRPNDPGDPTTPNHTHTHTHTTPRYLIVRNSVICPFKPLRHLTRVTIYREVLIRLIVWWFYSGDDDDDDEDFRYVFSPHFPSKSTLLLKVRV